MFRKAAPKEAAFLNTLGVAKYRNDLYREGVDSLNRCFVAEEGEPGAPGLSFLAMCHARLGDSTQSRHHLAKADAWVEKKRKDLSPQQTAEFKEFRQKAAGLLGEK